MASLPKLVRFSGGGFVDGAFYFLPLGKRRAVRACRWFGGGTLALRVGCERTLRDGLTLVRNAKGYELHGQRHALEHFLSVLADQERVERQAALA